MKLEQAVRIDHHLRNACAALESAERVIAGLGKSERLELEGRLDAVKGMLQEELLRPIYDQYPDLAPPSSGQASNEYVCELTWDEVKLPAGVTEPQLDDIILSVMKPTWRKTAMTVSHVMDRCKELGLAIEGEIIAARLKMLSDTDRIEGIGNIQSWLHSEVRLKD